MPKKIIKFLIILALFLSFGQDVLAITILSPVAEMEIEPGQSQKGILKVYNETAEDLTLISSVEPFAAGGQGGQSVYLSPEKKDKFLDWFELSSDSIVLKSRQFAVVPFNVAVPADAAPGGYYAVIFWQPETAAADKKNSAVGLNSKVGTLILLKVKGDLIEKGEVVEFAVSPSKNCYFGLPVKFILRFANSGNIHLAPAGEIELKNWFGRVKRMAVNPTKGNVLPGSTRRFEVVWSRAGEENIFKSFFPLALEELNNLAFGRYTADLNLSYDADNQQKISKRLSFWVIPARSIVVLLGLIFLAAVLFKINTKIGRLKDERDGKKQ